MVRQDHLESLTDPELSDRELHEARGVARFIVELLEIIRPNLISEAESVQRKQNGVPAQNAHPEGNPYMEISDGFDPEGA